MMEDKVLQLMYKKSGRMKHTSHRDLIIAWYMAVSRAQLPARYTEGFTRKPKIVFSPALPLGVSSMCEFAYVYLKSPLDPSLDVLARMNAAFPEGYSFYGYGVIAPSEIDGIVDNIKFFKYSFEIEFDAREVESGAAASAMEEIRNNAEKMRSLDSIIVESNGKSRNIKPYMNEIEYVRPKAGEDKAIAFTTRFSFLEKSTVKPQLLLKYLLGPHYGKTIYAYDIVKVKYIL